MIYYRWLDSPLGRLLLTSDGQFLTGLYLQGQKHFPDQMAAWQPSEQVDPFGQVQVQLQEYFAHQRQQFNLPIQPQGTDFQRQVWQVLVQIPYGETMSYGELAQAIQQPTAARAVGAANGRNPIAVVVPCHRVIASNGKLTGYAGGLDRKQWLLGHEQASPKSSVAFQPSLALFD